MPPDIAVPARRRGLDDARGQCLDRDEPGLPRGPLARRRSRRPPAAGRDARAGKERARGLGDAARGRGFRGFPPRPAAGRAPVRGRRRGATWRSAMLVLFAAVGAGAADRERERRQPAAAAGRRGASSSRCERRSAPVAADCRASCSPRACCSSLLAGLLAFAASGFLLRAVVALVPGGLPRLESVRADPLVVLFSLGVVLLAATLAGIAPVAFLSRIDLGGGAPGRTRRGRRLGRAARPARAGHGAGRAGGDDRGGRRAADAQPAVAPDGSRWAWPRTGSCSSSWRRCRPSPERPPDSASSSTMRSWRSSRGGAGNRGSDARPHPAVRRHRRLGPAGVHRGRPEPRKRREEPGGQPGGRSHRLLLDVRGAAAARAQLHARRSFGRARGRDRERGSRRAHLAGAEPARQAVEVRPTRLEGGVANGRGSREGRRASRELAEPRPTLYLPASQFIDEARILVLRSALPLSRVAELARAGVRAVEPSLQVTRVTSFAELAAAPLARPRFQRLPDRRVWPFSPAARSDRALRGDGGVRAPALLRDRRPHGPRRDGLRTCAASCSARA